MVSRRGFETMFVTSPPLLRRGARLVDSVTEQELVLLVQGAFECLDSLQDLLLDVVGVSDQCLELLDESHPRSSD